MSYEFIDLAEAEYRQFVESYPGANFLQSWQWGEAHQGLGLAVHRRGVRLAGQLVGAWTAVVQPARRGRFIEVSGGPLVDFADDTLVAAVLGDLKQLAHSEKCVFVRFRPQIVQSGQVLQLVGRYSTPAPMHLNAEHTNIVDLTKSEDELLAAMRRQTRYEVRRSAKIGLVATSRVPSVDDIEQFYRLQSGTASRQGFVQSSGKFLRALAAALGDQMLLYEVKQGDQVLNMALVVRYGGEIDYYEAASTPEARKLPGAYAIIWQAMLDGKLGGYQSLNLWGVAIGESPDHRFAGVTTFKHGFGGRDVEYLHAHDIVVNYPRYAATKFIETIRKKRRKL